MIAFQFRQKSERNLISKKFKSSFVKKLMTSFMNVPKCKKVGLYRSKASIKVFGSNLGSITS